MSIQLFLFFMRLLGGKASLVNTTHGWTGSLCKYCSATAKEGWQSRTGQARAVLLCYATSRSQIQFNDRIRRLQPAPLVGAATAVVIYIYISLSLSLSVIHVYIYIYLSLSLLKNINFIYLYIYLRSRLQKGVSRISRLN